ncbi:MAG: hypothetical protein HY094_01595 [Candidatus Melainabacteria bacterium]|nr:hypothetical protein [Candidatus Melainabacteria bacterium]
MAKPNECFSVIEMFDILSQEIKHGFEFEKKRDSVIKNIAGKIAELRKAHKDSSATTESLNLTVLPEKIPSTKDLLEQVKSHEKRRIKFDVHQALKCIKSKEEQLRDLKKYVEHIIAYIGKRAVRDQWRDGHNTQSNEEFMKNMETILTPLSSGSDFDRLAFRKKIALGVGDWSIDNRGKDSLDHLDEVDVMKDFIGRMIDHDIQSSEEKVKFFLQDLRTYYERGGDMKTHKLAEIEPERFKTLDFFRNLKTGLAK